MGAEVRDLNKRFPDPVISTINWMQNIEKAKGTRPMFRIMENYADVVLMLETILQFSGPLWHWEGLIIFQEALMLNKPYWVIRIRRWEKEVVLTWYHKLRPPWVYLILTQCSGLGQENIPVVSDNVLDTYAYRWHGTSPFRGRGIIAFTVPLWIVRGCWSCYQWKIRVGRIHSHYWE